MSDHAVAQAADRYVMDVADATLAMIGDLRKAVPVAALEQAFESHVAVNVEAVATAFQSATLHDYQLTMTDILFETLAAGAGAVDL